MKLKRFIALVVSLAMVLSIVPAFSLTASAAFSSSDYAISDNIVFDGSYATNPGSASAVYAADFYTGWTPQYYALNSWGYNQSNTLDVSGLTWTEASSWGTNTERIYGIASNNVNEIRFAKYNGTSWAWYMKMVAPSGGYGAGKDVLVVEWILGRTDPLPDAVYGGLHLYDADDNAFFYNMFDKNGSGSGYLQNGASYRVSIVNYTDTHDMYFERNTGNGYELLSSEADVSGTVNGFGGMSISRAAWNTDGSYISIGDLTVYASDIQGEVANVELKYVDENNTEIATSKTVSVLVGGTITLNSETNAPHVIEKDGVLYARDTTNTEVTVDEDTTSVTVTYTKTTEVESSKTALSDWFAIEWTMTGTTGYKDYWVKDTNGVEIIDFVYAAPTDGIYPGDRGIAGVSVNYNTRNRSTDWTSGTTTMRMVVQKTGDTTYSVYETLLNAVDVDANYLIADANCTRTDSNEIAGIGAPSTWLHSGGSGDEDFENVKYYAIIPETLNSVTATYTVNGETVNEVTKSYDTANNETSVSFDAYYYSANGSNVMYKADATTLSADTTIEMTAVDNADVGVYKDGYEFEWDGVTATVEGNNLIPNGDFGYGLAGWYGGTTTASNPVYATTSMVTLNGNGSITNNQNVTSGAANALYRAWKVEPGTTYVITATTDRTLDNGGIYVGDVAEYAAGETRIKAYETAGENQYVFVAEKDYVKVYTGWSNNATFSNFGLYEVSGLSKTYSVTAVDTDGNTLEEAKEVTALNVEALEIPYYEGYVLNDRTVDGLEVTYTYKKTEASLGSWAIRNNVDYNEYIAEMKFLGAHNAFANTSNIFESEGGSLYNVYGASPNALTESSILNLSRTQTLSAVDQLNAGVRYFDIRLGRQEDGSFVTVHGPAFNYFRPIAYTIAQWAKENPGEVILLDFQSMVDALYDNSTYTVITDNDGLYGATVGDDNAYVYGALIDLLEEAGIMDYVYYTGTGWDTRYGSLTNNGTKTAIVLIGKARLANLDDRFINRKNYTSTETTYKETSDFSTAVSNIDSKYGSITSYRMFGYIHAYLTTELTASNILTGGNLLTYANNYNSKWAEQANFEAWMGRGKGDVLMMNGITEEIGLQYLAYLDEWNRDCYDDLLGNNVEGAGALVSNGVTMTGAASALPYSTEFKVTTDSATGSYTINGTTYTSVSDYTLEFLQYDTTGVAAADGTTFTFATDGNVLKTYAIIYEDGAGNASVLGSSSEPGGSVSVTSGCASGTKVTLAETDAPGADMTINYQDENGDTIFTSQKFVVYGYEAYNLPAGKFWIANDDNTDAAIVESASAQSYTVTEAVDGTANTINVSLTLVERHAVLEDALVTADGNQIYGANSANNNKVFIGAGAGDYNGVDYDADGVRMVVTQPGNLSWSRTGLMQFPVVELGENEAAIAVLPVDSWHDNTWGGSPANTGIRLSAYALNTSEWIDYADDTTYNPADASKLLVTNPVFSTWNTSATTEVKFDVTEFMQAAKDAGLDYITIRIATSWGGCYMVQTEDAVAGGTQAGRAAYIDIVDANTVTVTGATKVTKSGLEIALTNGMATIAVPEDSTIKVYTEAPYVTDGTNVYAVTGGVTEALETTDGAIYSSATLGVTMVNGAQVRIGDGVDSEGKVSKGSGLRFITTVNRDASLVNVENATFGVEITAEGSDANKDAPAEKFQDDAETVFTTALTNLAVSNYNRNFTATPYVEINGERYYGDPVTRSIYQVASGLLAYGYGADDEYGAETDDKYEDKDGIETDYSKMSEVLINVLNAYVNQVGVRLVINDDGLAKSDKYTGDDEGTFFTVTETSYDEATDTYTCTLKATGEAVIKMNTIASEKDENGVEFYKEYVRINNNNGKTYALVTIVDNGDGTYELTFDASSLR